MSSTLNSTSLSKEALAFSVSRTSNCLSDSGLALTLTLMAMPGALSRPRSEFGAPGLSKERSFTYCACTLGVGWAPLPLVAAPACASLFSAMSLFPRCECGLAGPLGPGCRLPVGYHGAHANTRFWRSSRRAGAARGIQDLGGAKSPRHRDLWCVLRGVTR